MGKISLPPNIDTDSIHMDDIKYFTQNYVTNDLQPDTIVIGHYLFGACLVVTFPTNAEVSTVSIDVFLETYGWASCTIDWIGRSFGNCYVGCTSPHPLILGDSYLCRINNITLKT